MTSHSDLVARATKWARNGLRCPVVFAEIVTAISVIPDAMGFTSDGRSHYIECKRTRSDFFADRKKPMHRGALAPGDFRWYFTPPGLVTIEELPERWGLVECFARCVKVRQKAQSMERSRMEARADAMILVSALRRHQIGVEWMADESRFRPWSERALPGEAA